MREAIIPAKVLRGRYVYYKRKGWEEVKAAKAKAGAARQQAELVVFPDAFVGGYYKGHDFGIRLGLRSPQSPAAACIESVARGILIAPPEVIRHQLAGG